MIYLASPYSHEDEKVKEKRVLAVCMCAASLMELGVIVFSPIAHSHYIALHGNVPNNWNFWKHQDFGMLSLAAELWVYKLPGWDVSVGVRDEIEFAQKRGIKIHYIDPKKEELEVLK